MKIISADYVLTMNAQLDCIEQGAVLIDGQIIQQVGTREILQAQYPEAIVEHYENGLLMPGLVNTHCHSGFLRGTAEGLPVWDWLQQYIDPMHRVLLPEDAKIASYLCYAEALLSGTTTIVDMWRFMDGSAEAAKELGIRAVLVPYVAEHPDHDYFETLHSNEALLNRWHQSAHGRIDVWVGLEHLFYAQEPALHRIQKLCQDYKTGFHTHSNESQFDVQENLKRYGVRPIQTLEQLGLFDVPQCLLAHCVWANATEIDILKNYCVGVAHNPISNMKLASGAAPITQMLASGLAVGLGTDGEKENNNLDLFEEMKTASLLAKFSNLNAASLDAWSVCKMGTSLGAQAIGMQDKIGSLETGKQADMIVVNTATPRMTPLITDGKLFNLHHNLVHAVQGQDIVMTMVAGKILVQNGQLVNADLQKLIDDVNVVAPKLFKRRDLWLAQRGTSVNELQRVE
ncbi:MULTISPECIES: amidohydrolase family protein [Acinetobacter]|jgi:5-methylthioadenosine/S-adenosylhomocysteine deaminase|uniref:Amidohydrolase n=1 Tax=Acinetobacter chengduensis TaxID=2420890 RepID=A0ABX9TYL8_9GAMM|nr:MULTISPECIES: amidohydrolase [Acinetobacter]MBI1452275.1 amidohydrolase [Acinetobacter sp. FL51]RKG43276.1 amidohydrolase [Acinetobacter sp. WCHAc060007]RLL23117.1 amidohydrolase [Acinetobacter chengduensis]